jgi:hypothetical protein
MGGRGRKIMSSLNPAPQPGKKCETLPEKQTKTKQKDWGITQMAEHFPSKHKAVSSNPSTGKRKLKCRFSGLTIGLPNLKI